MQTKKIEFSHLMDLVDCANAYARSLPEKTKTPLSVKIEKVSPSLKKALAEYTSLVEDLRVDACSLDAEGNMIIKEGAKSEDRYAFKPEKLKKLRADIKKLNSELVSIDVNITSNVPVDLTYSMVKYFRGILIPEDYVYPEDKKEQVTKEDPELILP
jgi:hypothetical protein